MNICTIIVLHYKGILKPVITQFSFYLSLHLLEYTQIMVMIVIILIMMTIMIIW